MSQGVSIFTSLTLVVDLCPIMEQVKTNGGNPLKTCYLSGQKKSAEDVFTDLSTSFSRLGSRVGGDGQMNRKLRRRRSDLRVKNAVAARKIFQNSEKCLNNQFMDLNLRYMNMGASKDDMRTFRMYEAMRVKRQISVEDEKRLNRLVMKIKSCRAPSDNDDLMRGFRKLFREDENEEVPIYKATSGLAGAWMSGLGVPVNHNLVLPDATHETLSRFVSALEKGISLVDESDIPVVASEIKQMLSDDGVSDLGGRFMRNGVSAAISHVGSLVIETCKSLAQGLTGHDSSIVVLSVLIFILTDKHVSMLGKGLVATICGYILYLLDFKTFAEKVMEVIVQECGDWLNFGSATKPAYRATAGDDAPLGARLAHMFFLGFSKPSWEKFGYKEFIKDISFFQKSSGDITSVFSTLVECVQKIIDFVAARIIGCRSYQFVSTGIPALTEWIDKVLDMQNKHRRHELNKDQATADEVFKLYLEIIKMISAERDRSARQTIISSTTHLLRFLQALQDQLSQLGFNIKGPRIEPLILMLRGGSGVGKSFALRPLIFRLLARVLPDEEMSAFLNDEESFVYARVVEQDFWDGYLLQWVVFYDEFGMTPAKYAGATSEFSEFIRIGNPFDYPLHMADLASKGSVFFRSRIVVATSNLPNIRLGAQELVTYPDAVVRRFHFNVVVCASKEYCVEGTAKSDNLYDRVLDRTKVTPGVFNEKAYDFFLAEGQNEKMSTTPISYEDLLDRMTEKFFALEESANSTYSSVRVQKDKGLSERETWRKERESNVFQPPPTLFDLTTYKPIAGDVHVSIDEEDGSEFVMHDCFERPVHWPFESREHRRMVTDWLADLSDHSKEGVFKHSYDSMIKYGKKIFNVENEDISLELLDHAVFARRPIDEALAKMAERSTYVYDTVMTLILKEPTIYYYLMMSPEPLACDVLYSIEKRLQREKHMKVVSRLEPFTRRFYLYVDRAGATMKEELLKQLGMWKKFLEENVCFSSVVSAALHFTAGMTIVKLIRWFFRKVFPSSEPRVEATYTDIVYSYDDDQTCLTEAGIGVPSLHKGVKSEYKKVYTFVGGDVASTKNPLVDEGLVNILAKVMQKNVCFIFVEECLLGRVIFVKEQKAIMPYHFLKSITVSIRRRLSLQVILKNNVAGTEVAFSVQELITDDDKLGKRVLFVDPSRDFALIDFSHKHQTNYSDIRSLFVERNIGQLETGSVVAPVDPQNKHLKFYVSKFRAERGLRLGQSTFQSNISQVLIYQGTGAVGDCGFPIFLADPSARSARITGFIIGENAASQTVASAFVDQELILLAMKVGDGVNNPNYLEIGGDVSRCVQIGTLARPPGTNSYTSIRRSRLWGAWGPAKKRPSHLRPFVDSTGETVDPFEVAKRKFEVPYHDAPSREVVRTIFDAVASHLVNNSEPFKVIDATFEQCVAGIEDLVFFDSINRSSSPGYPGCMTQSPDFPGKTLWFGKNQEFEFTSADCDKLKDEFELNKSALERGDLPEWFYIFSLKDELLPYDKADKKTRGYSAESLPALLQTIAIFKCFLVWTMQNRIRNGFAPGINVYSAEWDRLYHHLNNFGGASMPGDFKQFDAIQVPLILDEMVEMLIRIYDKFLVDMPEKMKVRMRTCWGHIAKSKQIMRSVIIQVLGSNPSGNALTTLINGLYQLVLFFMAFRELVDASQNCYESFFRSLRFILFGDDSLVCPAIEIQDRFHFLAVQRYFSRIGITYTSAKKDGGEVHSFVPLVEATFLKRTFRFEPVVGRYVAPLALETILEMPYWTKKGVLKDEIERVNVVNALRELSLHAKEVFDEWAPQIVSASVAKLGFLPSVVDRKELILFVTDAGRVWMRDLKVSDTPRYESVSVSTYDRIFSDKSQKKQVEYSACGGLKPSLFRETKLDGLRDTNILFTACAGEVWANSSVKQLPAAIGTELDGILQDNKMESTDVVQETTTLFVDDATTVSNSVVGREAYESRLFSSAILNKAMSIEDFLAKPILVSSNVVSSMTPNTAIAGGDSPWVQDAFQLEKLKGYYGLRCDAEWRLEVSAPSTMAGMVGLFFEPFPLLRDSVANTLGPRRSMLSRFHLPHVVLDISCDTSATLTVPRVNPAAWFVVGGPDRDNLDGSVIIVPLSNLYVGTGTAYFSYRLYCTLTNVMMGAPALYQATSGNLSLISKEKASTDELKVVSGRMATAVVKTLPKIPLLSSLVGGARWVMESANNMAKAFGYSKPVSSAPVAQMVHTIAADLTTFDGVDNSKVLALSKDNAVSAFKGFARTEFDEASFAFLFSKNSYFDRLLWTDSDDFGVLLRQHFVGPRMGCVVDVPKKTVDATIMYYIANNFNYYRGSIIVTLRIVKTHHHSGRLRITFNPFTGGTDGFGQANQLLNEVIDVREASEWSFRLPFVSSSQWKYVPSPFDNDEAAFQHVALGKLCVYVMGRLTHPSTVSNTVEVLFFVRPGPDFELANTTQDTGVPVYNAIAGDLNCVGEEVHFIGGYNSSLDPGVATELCIGEQVQSVYQLTKRFGNLRWDAKGTTTAANVDINPFVICSADGVTPALPNPSGDYFSIFGACYALHRGSMRLKAMVSPGLTGGVYVTDALSRRSFAGTGVAAVTFNGITTRNRVNVPVAWFASPTATCSEVSVPGYYIHPCRPVMQSDTAGNWLDYVGPNTRVRFHTLSTGTSWNIYRATGEDFQMGLFFTCPLLYFP